MKRSLIGMIAAALGLGMSSLPTVPLTRTTYRGPTPSRRIRSQSKAAYNGCVQSDKDDGMPRGYPGAKLARKARQGYLAVNHPRGIRANGITC